MRALKHVTEQPFIFAVGLSALVHSTWSLGTLFNGKPPSVGLSPEFVYWFLPPLLIAFALDIGQIATSAEIREGQRTRTKYATFAVLAGATYFLQWLYIAHHMPALPLADGVRPAWLGAAQLFRDAALWIIPALLPVSTLLYTFSSPIQHGQIVGHEHQSHTETPSTALTVIEEPAFMPEINWIPTDEEPAPNFTPPPPLKTSQNGRG